MKSSNKIYIISAIFTLISLFLIVFFIWPLLTSIEKNSGDLISVKDNIATVDAQANETENFKKNYGTYKPNLEQVDQLFVDPINPVDFIKFLEDTAADRQITSQISLQSNYNAANQNFITFQFSSSGDFSEMLNFSKEIESGPYLIEIEDLTIQNNSTGNSVPAGVKSEGNVILKDYSSRKVSATFTIKAFTKK